MIDEHPLLAPARWRLPHSSSAALHATITMAEQRQIDHDAPLRRSLERLLERFVALDFGIEQLQFADERGVVLVELTCRAIGDFRWTLAAAVPGAAVR